MTQSTQLEDMYFTFQPRPDQPDRFDQQEAFYNSKHTGVTLLLGGNGAGTTTLALMKAMKFVLQDQPPPRPATPFWIISEGYPMVMDVCWNEKLCARGMLPACEVQWDKVDWFKPNQNWPFRVPLRPWPNHDPRNYWLLEFKSYEQGRSKMQASSIGGFVFVEQCPFELIVETLRGCRDYNFPGAKIAEFTPIDPALSAPLEQMIAEDRFPKDWAIYRCNTQCAMEAGHVSKEWFEEFFGMVSDEMREVRMTGAFASYEGLIYPGFFRRTHVVDGLKEQLAGMKIIRKRAIDWGSGPDNAMVCLWAAIDATGTICVYDEYYSTEQDKTYADHAKEIIAREPWPEDGFHLQTYADPASPGLTRLFSQSGVICTPAKNEVYEGIESVRVALKKRGDGDTGLLIDSRCGNMIRELSAYRWERARKSSTNPKNARPVPLKKNDHTCDALRYLVHTHFIHSRAVSADSRKITPKNQRRFLK